MQQWIEYKLAVLIYRCVHGIAQSYFVEGLYHVPDVDSRLTRPPAAISVDVHTPH